MLYHYLVNTPAGLNPRLILAAESLTRLELPHPDIIPAISNHLHKFRGVSCGVGFQK